MRRLLLLLFWVATLGIAVLKVAEWTSENWWMASLGFDDAQRAFWKWRLLAFCPAFGFWAIVLRFHARLAWHNAQWGGQKVPLLGPRAPSDSGGVPPEDRARLASVARAGVHTFILLSALICGVAAANHFDLWLLAWSGGAWGAKEGATGQDIGFFVWQYPALLWAWNAVGLLLLTCAGTVCAIAAWEGALDGEARQTPWNTATLRHGASLGALLLAWLGARCGLAFLGAPINFGWSTSGIYTAFDQSFAQPLRVLALVSSPIVASWFARREPQNPMRALSFAGLWCAGALVLPLIAPSFGRAVSGSPEAVRRENADIQRHLAATRTAWDLDRVEEHALASGSATFHAASVEEAPLPVVAWPQDALRKALRQNNTFTERAPSPVFLDREGDALVARQIEADPTATSATSALSLEANPSSSGALAATRKELGALVVFSTQRPTFAFDARFPPSEYGPTNEEEVPPSARLRTVAGTSGVTRENLWQGLVLALRFGDGSLLRAGAPVTWHLDPLERVQAVAPMVNWEGAQPHPIVADAPGGERHLFWLVEGCFSSRCFPDAAMLPSANEWSGLTYARQSVLATCDATTGETRFFLFDPAEPFARTWNTLLPGFFRPASELSPALRAATRLSPPLVAAQGVIWARYHPLANARDEALAWKTREDEWRPLVLDTSEIEHFDQRVVVQRGGRRLLFSLAAFAPRIGTLAAIPQREKGDVLPLLALLGRLDEGEDLWRSRGHAVWKSWRAQSPLSLQGSHSEGQSKLALWPQFDARGDVEALSAALSQAHPPDAQGGAPQWTLTQQTLSTQPSATPAPPLPANSPPAQDDPLSRAKDAWSKWKRARAQGQWRELERQEKELDRLLTPSKLP